MVSVIIKGCMNLFGRELLLPKWQMPNWKELLLKSLVSNASNHFIAKGEMIKFDGFLKVYMESTDDEDSEEQDGMLPKLNEGEVVFSREINAIERFSKPKPRFTEASLVKRLEELGIGRPSTYASTITTIQNRGYVEKGQSEGVLKPYISLTLKDKTITEEQKSEKQVQINLN